MSLISNRLSAALTRHSTTKSERCRRNADTCAVRTCEKQNKLNTTSDFNDNELIRPKFKDASEVIYPHGTTGGNVVLNHENGHYQTITTNASMTISFTNLPASGSLGRIIFDVTFVSTAHTITIPTAVLVSGNVSGGDGSSNTITAPTSGRYLYEFMTPDGGTTILMHQLGNNYI